MLPHILAHEKWFIDPDHYPLKTGDIFRPHALMSIGVILVVTAIAGIVWWKRNRREILPGPLKLGASPERMCGFYGLVPAILAIHLAVPLLVNGIQRHLFSVNNELHGAPSYFMGLAMVGCALSFFYGGMARVAAVVLGLLWFAGLFTSGIEPMLDNIHMLGFAAFFFCAGRGPIAIDRLIFPFLEPSPQLMARAVPLLRIGVGLSLIFVAFTEKLANSPMALAFLQQFPVNFTPKFGIPMSDELFILCAGSVELLVGLFLTFGIFQREIVLIAWVPINISLSYFNWNATELVGHLPIYGAMAVLLIWAPGGEHVPLFIRGLREGPLGITSRDGNLQENAKAR